MMKTVQFKLKLNHSQQSIIDSWLESLRWVWNEGLSLLLECHHHQYYAWLEKKTGSSDYRKCFLSFSRKNAFAASCPIASGRNAYPSSPLEIPPPRLKYDNYKGLTGYMTKERYPERQFLQGIPAKFVAGTLKHLAESWKAYKDRKRDNANLPSFKSRLRGDKITSLYCLQPESIKLLKNAVKCPGTKVLGNLKIVNRNLEKRWDNTVQARTLQIVKRPSGYYLNLAGNLPDKPEKSSPKSCGIDVGLEYIYSDDAGKQVNPPHYYRKAEKHLSRLQRKLARQKAHRDLIKEEIQNICQQIAKLPEDCKFKAAAGEQAREILEAFSRDSRNAQKTKHKIALTHEKIRLQRRAFNHKISTYLVRSFEAIAVEDIKISNLNRRPKPKKREDGKGWERNNAKAKSGLNKSFSDAALGQLLIMIEGKAQTHQREFIKVAPHFTSQDCPQCGSRQKKNLSQRTHRCVCCHYIAPRDVAASINIKAKADFTRSYPTLVMGKVKPLKEIQSISMQEESTLVEPGCDAATIPSRQGKNNRKQKKKCASQEMFINQESYDTLQSLTLPAIDGKSSDTTTRAPAIPGDSGISAQPPPSKKQKSALNAQMLPSTLLKLDLWNTADEISSNPS
jgi:putative transposase